MFMNRLISNVCDRAKNIVYSPRTTSYLRLIHHRNEQKKSLHGGFREVLNKQKYHLQHRDILATNWYQRTVGFCTDTASLSEVEYEELAENTLQALSEKFDEIQETCDCDSEYDVTIGSGVLTVKISSDWGTYVINKQSPNKQIWLSSPVSGPKRYDYVEGVWIYKHDGNSIQSLLTKEISEALCENVDFSFLEDISR